MMKHIHKVAIGIIMAVLLSSMLIAHVEGINNVYDTYTLKMSVTVTSDKAYVPPNFLGIGVPINFTSETVHQMSEIISGSMEAGEYHTHKYTLETDEDMNVGVSFGLDKNVSKAKFEVEAKIYIKVTPPVDLDLERSGSLKDIPESVKATYLDQNDAWVINEDITTVAKALLDPSNVLRTVLNYASWIDENILYPYEPSHLEPWNSTLTLRYGEGDCDDRAILLIAMAKAVGIPAYLQIGGIYMEGEDTIVAEGGRLKYDLVDIGWHGWAMIYIPPWGWLPVDLTYFEGVEANLVIRGNASYLRILASNPLDHILGAALYTEKTFILGNIIKTDYIGPFKELVNIIWEYEIFWTEIDELNYEGVNIVSGISSFEEVKMEVNTAIYASYILIGGLISYKILRLYRERRK